MAFEAPPVPSIRACVWTLDLAFGLADDFDDVHRAYLGRVLVQLVQVGDDLLFVGDGDIQPAEVGILLHDLHELFDAGNLEVDILGVDVLSLELFVEVDDGKRMLQRVAY